MNLPSMVCPGCDGELEARRSRRGVVWICRSCRSGAATLPLLRQVAPRRFVDQLWQAAQRDGQDSVHTCPSCTQPFTTFHGSRARIEPHMEVCTRCYWVWLSPRSLAALPDLAGSGTGGTRQQLCLLAGEAIRSALD